MFILKYQYSAVFLPEKLTLDNADNGELIDSYIYLTDFHMFSFFYFNTFLKIILQMINDHKLHINSVNQIDTVGKPRSMVSGITNFIYALMCLCYKPAIIEIKSIYLEITFVCFKYY